MFGSGKKLFVSMRLARKKGYPINNVLWRLLCKI